ncbi:hypothetical protein IP65_08015 [Novosphingobium sp. AAP1]|uniref:arylsulfotransferase family protein n=1 Tax=Novosphingobium sp. AAP1 TaxID=1523413 RepID=UPI0006CD3B12|nr:arylsulfotransferase family protein [Novosphingobium sp. AAP1]KPF54642.1 hypothetical protein IP65_08015 [Novosphingobium sp. AAP1]
MSRPVPLWALGLTLALGALVLLGFGFVLLAPRRHGALGELAVQVASIPDTVGRAAGALLPYHPTIGQPYEPLPGGLWRRPGFVDPGYILLTVFDTARRRWVVQLLRLRDGEVVRTYAPDIAAILAHSTFRSALIDLARDKTNQRFMAMHPMLMPDGGLIVHDTSPLVRIDACGRPEWMIDGIFHHSLERAPDGTLWASYRLPRTKRPGLGPQFADEGLMHLTAAGKVLGRTAVIDLLDANNMGQLWRGRPYSDDPIHLNDIQPVPGDGPYWRSGDLLISLRNLSLLLLYRPSTGKVVWSRGLPWRFQHDVSVLDDHRISVFDNHWRFAWDQPEQAEPDGTNRMLVYDFATDQVSEPLARAFRDLNIHTRAQGRATPLPGGDTMVEETELGRVVRLAADGTVRWNFISADADRNRFELRWTRYIDPVADKIGIQAAENARCE